MLIEKIVEVSDEILLAVTDLIHQLGLEKTPPTRGELTAVLNSPDTSLLVARIQDGDAEIAGILTLIIYRVPTGVRSIIEDVVVNEKYRGQGIAKSLLQRAIELAREAGAGSVSLTSNPNRKEANSLYHRVGFQLRETNNYFLNLK